MSATSVSVVVPVPARTSRPDASLAAIASYLETTGFTFEILTPAGEPYGAALRRGAGEAKGSVIVVVDPALPYAITAIGDAVALIESTTTDVVFGSTHAADRGHAALRWILGATLPDPTVSLKAFSSTAAKVVIGETRFEDTSCDLEIAFLVNRYGFRIERLVVPSKGSQRAFGAIGGIIPAIRIRLANRNNAYRAPRRCPVCYSSEVWSRAQIPGNVVRACKRCKCRYLNQFTEDDGGLPVRRVLRPQPLAEPPTYEAHSPPAREKTSLRRLAMARRQLAPRARILEIGVRDGSFGAFASKEFEYVGIDPAPVTSRHARARGLEVYCAALASFVNTGPAFDAITLYHVFENMADPHDTLGRIKDLLKPGGILFLSTFDTEGLIYMLTEKRRMAQNFRTHLILYSRSALIELLERSGFEILDIGPDFVYRDHKFVRHWMTTHHPVIAPLVNAILKLVPDPTIASTGSIRIIARRRGGPSINVRAIRSVEPTHAR
jgi:2-polyprenyl-3-methyl-5-hydroxy-6-metoxy-1,4-benzoquinol methylase